MDSDGFESAPVPSLEAEWDEAMAWAFRQGFTLEDDEPFSVKDGEVSYRLVAC